MSSNFRVFSLACSSALLFLSSSAFGQTEGVCFVDLQQNGTPCVCLSEEQQEGFRLNDSAVLCDPEGAQQLSRLTPNLQDPIDAIDPNDPVDPVDPTQPTQPANNGIGNDVQDAPGNSGVTNGDVADGDQSEETGVNGTAANGDTAGAGNNGNGGNGNDGNGG